MRLTLFTPDKVQECPVKETSFTGKRRTFVQKSGSTKKQLELKPNRGLLGLASSSRASLCSRVARPERCKLLHLAVALRRLLLLNNVLHLDSLQPEFLFRQSYRGRGSQIGGLREQQQQQFLKSKGAQVEGRLRPASEGHQGEHAGRQGHHRCEREGRSANTEEAV